MLEKTPVSAVPDWDTYFMSLAYLTAMRSKDANTHIGAIIVGPDREIRSTGYNSFVRGIDDSRADRQERPEKYFWFEHAERNAILNAARVGIPLLGCRMYTNGIPCMDCARAIVQAGIKEVVVDKKWDDENSQKWSEHSERTVIMFNEAGVALRFWTGNIVQINKYRRGEFI